MTDGTPKLYKTLEQLAKLEEALEGKKRAEFGDKDVIAYNSLLRKNTLFTLDEVKELYVFMNYKSLELLEKERGAMRQQSISANIAAKKGFFESLKERLSPQAYKIVESLCSDYFSSTPPSRQD